MLFSFFISSCSQPVELSEKIEIEKTELRNIVLGPGCGANILDQCVPPNVTTLPFTLNNVDGYPGCSFEVSVTLSECSSGSFIMTYVGDFFLTTYNCPQYTIDLQNAINAGGTVLTDFILNFEKKLYNAFEIHYFNLNPLNCGSGQNRFFNWYLDACKQYCLRYIQSENQLIQTRGLSCGTGCCLRQSNLCKDPITGQIRQTTFYNLINQANCGTIYPDFGLIKCDAISLCALTCQ